MRGRRCWRAQRTCAVEEEARSRRGRIISADGVDLARSDVQPNGYVKRSYSTPALSHVTGYWSLRYGASGIEGARNGVPAWRLGRRSRRAGPQSPAPSPTIGNDVVLTIDTRVQKAADDALGKRAGRLWLLTRAPASCSPGQPPVRERQPGGQPDACLAQ